MKPVTQWFIADPVNVGIYESAKVGEDPDKFAHFAIEWNGYEWIWSINGNACIQQLRIWRGLADKPGKA